MAVDLVSDVKGTATVFGHNGLAFLFWFEIPDGVVEFGMLLQLFDRHWCHGG